MSEIVGRRVTAWTGPFTGQTGTITRINGVHYMLVRFHNGGRFDEHVRRADFIATELLPDPDEPVTTCQFCGLPIYRNLADDWRHEDTSWTRCDRPAGGRAYPKD